jgi:YesN/AraC family two-component response regulator
MMKIMIVEDNSRARCALKALISQQAEIIVTAEASNGQEALHNINEQVPDIVLMDMNMPVMNGLEATRIIKTKWPQIKIIVLTMYPDYRSDALKAGADAFLLKGCPVEELMSLIHNLQKRKTREDFSIFGLFPSVVPPLMM